MLFFSSKADFMGNAIIRLEKANLFYPSSSFLTKSIKEDFFNLLKIKKQNVNNQSIHALRDIDLCIREGERVGIIGPNGAGKSSLLKVIAGIYPLSSGTIEVHGKIRSLFELSLGFEQEATGRENIIYRGLLLGETPKSIKDKQQEIIDFAELGDFIDYPIKTYSAGMLVRLAFAISTSISGEILLIDEVFGAGDASFQAKARNRMQNLINQAKIIVFVSHDLSSIRTICERCVFLYDGRVFFDGNVEEAIKTYQSFCSRGLG